jgi:outer membrane protein TolC
LQAQSQMTSAEVAFEVARLYESWLFARDLTLFFDDTLHWLGRAVDSTDEQIERGSGATEQDKLRIQAATGAVQIGFHQADAGRRQAEGGLVAYLALPPGTTLQPVEERFEALKFEPVNEHTLGGLALQKRPEITALAAGAQAYRALGDAEQADDLPDFFALAFASGAFTPGRDLIDTRFVVDPLNHFVPGALLGARWKWGTGGMASARAEENYAKARELQQTRRWAEHGFPAQVKKALEDVRRASLDIRSAEVAVQQSKSWTVRASADYAIGFGDSRDVADSSTAFVRLRVAYLEAILRHNIALAELAKATGTLKASDSPFYPTKE